MNKIGMNIKAFYKNKTLISKINKCSKKEESFGLAMLIFMASLYLKYKWENLTFTYTIFKIIALIISIYEYYFEKSRIEISKTGAIVCLILTPLFIFLNLYL